MKLRYEISKSTELSSADIIEKIRVAVYRRKYSVVNVTQNSVSFDEHTAGLVWRSEYIKRMKSGEFSIINNMDGNIVIFEYYPIPLSGFITVGVIALIITGIAIINHAAFAGLFVLPFLGQLIYQHYNLKLIAEEILIEVTS